MFLRWRRNRQIQRHGDVFWDLARRGETSLAVEYYDAQLKSLGPHLPPAMRAAYHFLRRQLFHEDADLTALVELSSRRNAEHVLLSVRQFAEQSRLQSRLARALVRPPESEALAEVLREAGRPPTDARSLREPLERLATCLLQHRLAEKQTDPREVRLPANRVWEGLAPLTQLSETTASIRARLMIWAATHADRLVEVLDDASIRAALPPDECAEILQGAAYVGGVRAVAADDVAAAMKAFTYLRADLAPAVVESLALRWGTDAIEHGQAKAALRWLYKLRDGEAGSGRQAFVLMGIAVGLMKLGRFTDARKYLQHLLEAMGRRTTSTANENAELFDAQTRYVTALSHLAETRTWASPDVAVSSGDDAEDRDGRVRYRALWADTRTAVADIMAPLAAGTSRRAWLARLLEGLTAHVDRKVLLQDEIKTFAAAVEEVSEERARAGLQRILGACVARARASEEALALLIARDDIRLAELKRTLLDRLGDAVAPVVRAAVAMRLWSVDPLYDPLPDLLRIPHTDSSADLVDECLRQVRLTRLLEQLAGMCRRRDRLTEVLPGLDAAATIGGAPAFWALAARAMIELRQGDFAGPTEAAAALERSSEENAVTDAEATSRRTFVAALRFYLGWKRGDTTSCRHVCGRLDAVSFGWMPPPQQRSQLIEFRELRKAVHDLDEQRAAEAIGRYFRNRKSWNELLRLFVAGAVRYLEAAEWRQAACWMRVARGAGAEYGEPPAGVEWLFGLFTAFTLAQARQLSACVDECRRTADLTPPPRSPLGDAAATQDVHAWLTVMWGIAELAQAIDARGDAALRIRDVSRFFARRATAWKSRETHRAYAALVEGLLLYLQPERTISADDVTAFKDVQRRLNFSKPQFLGHAVDRVERRLKQTREFWDLLRGGMFAEARQLLAEALQPLFDGRLPPAVRFGALLADWAAHGCSTADALARLAAMEREAPESGAENLRALRSYLVEGDRVRRLVQALLSRRYAEVVGALEAAQSQNAGGSVVERIALLVSLVRTNRREEAAGVARELSQIRNVDSWTASCAALVEGMLYHEGQDFPAAVAAFQRIRTRQVAEHDVGTYLAAAEFSQALQLLRVDQKDKAFHAFRRALGGPASAEGRADLAPLFVHFGLRGLELRNGARAESAFLLAEKCAANQGTSPHSKFHLFAARLGRSLCEALLSEDGEPLKGDRFLELGPLVQGLTDGEGAKQLSYVLQAAAYCQELRGAFRNSSSGKRMKAADLYKYLSGRITAMDKLRDENQPADPALMAARGTIDLVWGDRAKQARAADTLDACLRLGVQSPRLSAFFEAFRKDAKRRDDENNALLTHFEGYLAAGDIPTADRMSLTRQDDFAEFYRMTRRYEPDDILVEQVETSSEVARSRINDLLSYVRGETFRHDSALQAKAASAAKLVESLMLTEAKLHLAEADIMRILAQHLRRHSFQLLASVDGAEPGNGKEKP